MRNNFYDPTEPVLKGRSGPGEELPALEFDGLPRTVNPFALLVIELPFALGWKLFQEAAANSGPAWADTEAQPYTGLS